MECSIFCQSTQEYQYCPHCNFELCLFCFNKLIKCPHCRNQIKKNPKTIIFIKQGDVVEQHDLTDELREMLT